jgi:hypothetical protein
MKSKIIISLVVMIILIFFFTIFVYSNQYDFRKTNWGINKEQVKVTEKAKIAEIYEDGFAYKDTVADLDCNIVYQFIKDKLYIAGYIFTGLHTNYDLWIDDYQKVKEILIKKYGKPIASGMFWTSDLHKEMWVNNQEIILI